MRKRIITSIFLITTIFINAQKIEIKGNDVLLDGNTILKSEKINAGQYSFYSLDDNEILMYKWFDNETPKYQDDDYYILNFLEQKVKVQSTDFTKVVSGIGMNSKKNMEKMLTWLLKEKVLLTDGKLNPDRVNVLFEKYDENITQRTFR
jgi:hypothetical protein